MLHDILSNSKFLLVLDGYWSENPNDWDIVSWPLRSCCEGSKIIVITTNKKVSVAVCSRDEYTLEILSDDDCWKLIQQRAKLTEESRRKVESIGLEIAKKCNGIPLVATLLGNMLRSKSTPEEWSFVLETELWDMPKDYNVFIRLMQSFVQLPPRLQRCFGYCSIFPHDYEFQMEEVTSLWVAEGYVDYTGAHGYASLAGTSYFNDLSSRFFFGQCTTTSKYKMHKLIHDLARLVSKYICLHARYDELNPYPLFGNACHLSLLHDGDQPVVLEASLRNERLRTFLLINSSATARNSTTLDPDLFSYLKFLRVLGLANAGLCELTDNMEELKYLRYLNLSGNPISSLPASLCNVVALQILKLRDCKNLCRFPKEMSNLINLLHFEFDVRMYRLMPPHFRKLINLQYLSGYIVGKDDGCGIGEITSLNCLHGILCIRKIEISSASEATEAKLHLKLHLDTLELEWSPMGQHDSLNQLRQAHVFEELRPHVNVKNLVVNNYFGMIYPAWLSDASHMFTSIHLNGLKHCDYLPSIGELPCLTSFVISNMPGLTLIDDRFYGASSAVKFPSLQSFKLSKLSNLTRWEGARDTEIMPKIQTFELDNCPVLVGLPENLRSLLPNSEVTNCPLLLP